MILLTSIQDKLGAFVEFVKGIYGEAKDVREVY